jgi:predicted Fe-S protein YdhL (DUF1289 family)
MPDQQLTVAPPSRCVGVCRIDESSGYCVGCARTREEIASWRTASAEAQIASFLAVGSLSKSNRNGFWTLSLRTRIIVSWVSRSKENLGDSCMGRRLTFTVIAGLAPSARVRASRIPRPALSALTSAMAGLLARGSAPLSPSQAHAAQWLNESSSSLTVAGAAAA